MSDDSNANSAIKYYDSRQSVGAWTGFVALPGVICIGGSLGAHSLLLTLSLLFGTIVVWWIGYWILSKSRYYISPTVAGFKDAFRAREVRFDEIRCATKSIDRDYQTLIFECDRGTVKMPFDPLDQGWFSAVKAELAKRGITVSNTAYGFSVKQSE